MLVCWSLQDYLAIPCFLKLSHFLLGTPAVNSSWVGARYVFFPGTSPNQAVTHFTIKHSTQQSVWVHGHGEGDVISWLFTAGVGGKAQAVLRALFSPLALYLRIKLLVKFNFFKATPNSGKAQSPAKALYVHFAPCAHLSPYATSRPISAHCRWIPSPTPRSHQPNAELLRENAASRFGSDQLQPATTAIICISRH